ncbi:hypothetical protein Q1695_007212 [Nippostrongylus brasiliensis]|nr:hypothetical protein Q1695_007212 [Nippostrongylus brasiliensis]
MARLARSSSSRRGWETERTPDFFNWATVKLPNHDSIPCLRCCFEHLRLPPVLLIAKRFRYTSACDKLLLLLGSCVAVGTGMGMPLMSIASGRVTQGYMDLNGNSSTPKQFETAVIQSCFHYLYLGCGVFLAGTIQTTCFIAVCENLVNRLRRKFFKAILHQDIAWFDTNNSGELATKLFDNLERFKEGTGDKIGLTIQYIAQSLGGFVIAFVFSWKLTLIMMSLTPFMIVCGSFMAKRAALVTKEEAKKYAEAGKIAEEALTSMKTVIAFNGQQYECERYDQALESAKAVGIKKSICTGMGLAFTSLLLFTSYCLGFWVGTDSVFNGEAQGGTVVTVFFSVLLGSTAIGQAGTHFSVIGTAAGATSALYEVIDKIPEIDSYSKEGERPHSLKGRVTVSDLKFAYSTRPDVQVLKGVSFEVNPGETVALVGSSGCGKSTIIQLLLRYYNPNEGKILIDGKAIEKINIEFLRNFIGVVLQEPRLFNTTIEQNIRYGREDITEAEILAALRRANAYDFVQALPSGIHTNVGDRGTQLSGGQKQRIAIARALVRDPKILLLDEATSALDADSEHVVQQALENASKGRTTIVVAHRLSTIRNANRIIAMKDGVVVEIGTHCELMARNGLYHELVSAQVFSDIDGEATTPPKPGLASQLSRSSAHSTDEKYSHPEAISNAATPGIPKKAENDLDRLKKEVAEEGAANANFSEIFRHARPEWCLILMAVLSCTVQGCTRAVFSLVFTQMMEVFSKRAGDPELKTEGHFWALMFLVLGVINAIINFSQSYAFGLSAERFTKRLRSLVFRNVMRMDASYFDMPRHSAGRITTRLATDAPCVKSAIDHRLGAVLSSIVQMGCGIAIGFYFGWQMALLTAVIFPLSAVTQTLQRKYIRGRAAADAKEMENSGQIAMEAIEQIKTVQASTLEHRLYNQFCLHLDRLHSTNKRKSIIQGLCYGFSCSPQMFLMAASFRLGGWVIFPCSFAASGLGYAAAYFPEYVKATFAAGLIFNMLKEEPLIDGMTTSGKKPSIAGAIVLKNVHFKYPERRDVPVLCGLNIEVNPGETLALVGPSGCGKSTVISLLERMYDPMEGVVAVDGNDLREVNPSHLRSHMALVSQEPILFDISIRDNIVYGLPSGSVSDEEIHDAARRANIHKFITELPDGYNTRAGEGGTQLSGGQKQRIAIARALIRNPNILLLDEATSALDTESEKLVQEALDKASEGRTCIIVAHRLSTIVNASCIVVVKDGSIVEKGTHQELMQAKGAYWALTQKQSAAAAN